MATFDLPVDLNADEASYRKQFDRLAASARLAAAVDCRRAITQLAAASDELPMHENFELTRKRLGEVAEALAEHDIRLGVEFQASPKLREGKAHEFIHTHEALLKLVESAPGDVGVVLDIWQSHIAGSGMNDLRNTPLERIVAVQMSDAPADKPREELTEEDRLLPSHEGACDLHAAFLLLEELGYEGPLTPVVDSTHFEGRRRDDIVRMVSDAMNTIEKPAPEPEAESEDDESVASSPSSSSR